MDGASILGPRGSRCAVLARALDEPLAGTAPEASRWLCVEQSNAWPQNVSAPRDPILQALARRAAGSGWRLLLIRRPGRRAQPSTLSRPVTVFLADTDPACPRLARLSLRPADLAGLALPRGEEPLPGTPVTEPLLLVCTHGRQDRCCALDGRALVNAVTAGCPEITPQVWESSHLGGHRFAPTALVLPTGYLYGRLDPATAIEVHKAAAHGEMEPLLCRGRSTWSAAGQVAELAVRRETGLREATALQVQPIPAGGEVIVTAADGRCWAVTVERAAAGGTRPVSCGADPTPVTTVRAGAVRELSFG